MSAAKKYQPQGGIVDWRAYGSLYNKLFDKIRMKKEKVPVELSEFFAQEDTNLETMRVGEVSPALGVPLRNNDTDRIPMAAPLEGYYVDFTNVQRRLGIMVTRQAVEAQKTNMISSMMVGLPDAEIKLEQMSYAGVLNGAFASTTTGDGSYLCATDHYYEDPQYGQWSNTAASGSAFTPTSYFDAWSSFQSREGSNGTPEPKNPKYVVYPVGLAEQVMKIKASTQYPQNSLNAKMPEMLNDFTPKICHWLTDTGAWFVFADEESMNRGLTVVWQTRPEYQSISDSMNPDLIMGKRLRVSFSVGAVHGRDIYGNSGA